MSKGIEISSVDIDNAKGTDFIVNSKFQSGMKLHDILTFQSGGERTLMSNALGLYAFIQRKEHGLDYTPAYIAFRGFGPLGAPTFFSMPFSNYIITGGGSDFVNVDSKNIVVGFDETQGADFIKVIIFEEKLAP